MLPTAIVSGRCGIAGPPILKFVLVRFLFRMYFRPIWTGKTTACRPIAPVSSHKYPCAYSVAGESWFFHSSRPKYSGMGITGGAPYQVVFIWQWPCSNGPMSRVLFGRSKKYRMFCWCGEEKGGGGKILALVVFPFVSSKLYVKSYL